MTSSSRLAASALLLAASLTAPHLATAAPARPKPPAPPKFQSIVAFCQAKGTVDHPPEKGFGPPEDGGVPPELSAIGANKWRCLDKAVLVCADSADGDQCGIKSPDRRPASLVEECRGQPNSHQISFAAGHFSQFDWRCRGGKPVIAKTYPLDARGFFAKAWGKLVVKDGRIIGPKQAPDILR